VMRTGASPIHLSIVSNGSYGLMESWARVLDFFANVGVSCWLFYRNLYMVTIYIAVILIHD
jgi:hypothetical protein